MGMKFNPISGEFDLVGSGSLWEEETGAYTALTQKTNGSLLIDTGTNEATPYTISGIPPNVNFVADNGGGAFNLVGVSSHGYGGFFDLGSLLFFNRSRGTAAAPTALQAGDYIGGQLFGGYGAGDYQLAFTGLLSIANDDWDVSPGAADLKWMANSNVVFSTATLTGKTTASFEWQFDSLVSISDGTAGSPSLMFSNDNDTGFYSANPNELGIAAGGNSSAFFGTGTLTSPFLELAPVTKTLTEIAVLVGVNDQYTLDFVNAFSPGGYDYSSTLIYAQNGAAFGSGLGFFMRPTITNDSASTRTIGPWLGYSAQPIYQANGGSLSGQAIDFFAKDTFNRINSGTVSFSNHYQYWAAGGSVETGATVTNRYGFYFSETGVNTGTLTSEAAFVSATLGGTNKTHFLMGTSTIPSGTWGIYQSSTEDNYFAGDIQIADGSAAGPSLTFLNDPDTGIHRVGTNQFSLNTAGTSRMQISSLEVTINPGKIASNDFRVHGDTVDNLIFFDVSADSVTFGVDPTVPDEAYGSSWNGSLEVPTKNAVYDKIEVVNKKSVTIQVTGGTDNVTIGDGKAYFTIPEILNGFNLSRAQATVVTAGTTNATTVMIHNLTQTADMLSGAISIASGGTVGTVGTIDGSNDDVATNDIIRIDVDSVSTTAPKGLMVILEFTLP